MLLTRRLGAAAALSAQVGLQPASSGGRGSASSASSRPSAAAEHASATSRSSCSTSAPARAGGRELGAAAARFGGLGQDARLVRGERQPGRRSPFGRSAPSSASARVRRNAASPGPPRGSGAGFAAARPLPKPRQDRTLATCTTPAEFGARFGQRLAALGRVQGLLSREVAPSMTVGEPLRLELGAHGVEGDGEGPVRLDGPEGVLPARAVQPLALAVHELLTDPSSTVRSAPRRAVWPSPGTIGGTDGQRRLCLDWTGSGIALPPAAATRRRGFGLDLIKGSLHYELDAETRIAFGPDGLRCTIGLPIEA